jgi:hypothetical protein
MWKRKDDGKASKENESVEQDFVHCFSPKRPVGLEIKTMAINKNSKTSASRGIKRIP